MVTLELTETCCEINRETTVLFHVYSIFCVLAGGVLGHAGLDGGLLHVHQQEGL